MHGTMNIKYSFILRPGLPISNPFENIHPSTNACAKYLANQIGKLTNDMEL